MNSLNISFGSVLGIVLASAGGGAAVAVAIVRAFGAKWLESLFSERLQRLRHDHDREIEALRSRISLMLNHSAKLSDREFDILPEAWAKVFDAYVDTTRLLARIRQSPDFEQNEPKALDEFLASEELSPFQLEKIRSLPPREQTNYFLECRMNRELKNAKVAAQQADFFLTKSGLFLEEDVHQKLSEFMVSVWEAIVAHEVARDARGEFITDHVRDDDVFRKTADDRVKDLERYVRARFWRSNQVVTV